jgi:hypothetical protein
MEDVNEYCALGRCDVNIKAELLQQENKHESQFSSQQGVVEECFPFSFGTGS